MGVTCFEHEIAHSVPPAKMFRSSVLEHDTFIPRVVPHVVKCVEVIQGDGGPGTIKKIHFSEGHKFKFTTHRIDAVDIENHSISYTVIDGDILCGYIESISHELTVSASPNGGFIYKNKIKYHTKGDEDCTEHANGVKEEGIALFKAIEAHFIANPGAF